MLGRIEAYHVPLKDLTPVTATQHRDLVDQLASFSISYEIRSLYSVDHDLQLRDAEATVFDVVSLFMTDHLRHDFKTTFIQQGDIHSYGAPFAGDV